MITYQRLLLKTFTSILGHPSQRLNTLASYSFSSQNDNNNNKYEYPFNFNREQYKGYIKKVQKAKKQITEIQNLQKGNIVPRRSRRIYDRPKNDTDLTGYAAWGMYSLEETQIKFFDHSMPVVGKIMLSPKWLVHAVGQGLIPLNNRLSSHRQYVFEDNNLSKFILYQYRNTTHYKKNTPDFDYENQQHLRPQMRKVKRLQPQDFWQSEQQFEFRLNCTQYAEHFKFVKWLRQTIQKRKSMESYDAFIDKKFGRAFCFNEKEDMELFQPRTPFIMHVKPQHFQSKNEQKQKQKQKPAGKGKKDKKGEAAAEKTVEKVAEKPQEKVIEKPVQQKPTYNFAYKLDEQYRQEVKTQKKEAQSNKN